MVLLDVSDLIVDLIGASDVADDGERLVQGTGHEDIARVPGVCDRLDRGVIIHIITTHSVDDKTGWEALARVFVRFKIFRSDHAEHAGADTNQYSYKNKRFFHIIPHKILWYGLPYPANRAHHI